jgi:KipI family sensor histidine kinase inhibitor
MGEAALLIGCGDLATVRRVDAALQTADLPWIRDIVPAYDTVLVIGRPGYGPQLDALAAALPTWQLPAAESLGGELILLEVRYDGADLAEVSALTGLAVDEVVARHTAPVYRVAFLGFSPGFPYLLGLDPMLQVPRLHTPRTSVPPGSVGIGGDQTGVYPTSTPGGWRLIGTTSASLFDPARDPVTLLRAGDSVRFVAT